MDGSILLALIVSSIWVIFFLLKPKLSKHASVYSRLPPGPKSLPIIGNLHQLGERPHRSLAELARTYGPLMYLKFGTINTIVVSSSKVAKEMFQKHDLSLANRKVPAAVRANGHDMYSIAWLPICPKWRTLRKISAVHSLSNQRLDASQSFRQAKVADLLEYVKGCSVTGEVVDIGKAAFTTSLNLLSNTFFSFDLASHRSSDSGQFKDLVWKIMEEIGKPNLADCFPMLRFFSSISVNQQLMGYGNKLNEVFADIINERLKNGVSNCADNDADVLDTLLRLMKNDSELCLDDIKHLLMDFFTAGTDTTSSTLEWAMTELLHDPEKMIKAQAELKQVLGNDNLMVLESDIPSLPYLQAIVKETLRMHPPTVFLLPRQADADVELYGYLVPKNAQIFVNLWAISRDPNAWENPDVFIPERFLGRDIDMKGQDFGLIPFGSGRRICPGLTLAYRMLNLMLGTLIHAFHWELANGLSPKDLDMMDKFGITIQKEKPLLAIPISK
uniref:Cytochrome P450 76AD1-like protein n=1 Tax=Acleisanthes lanceolata TaxID=117596 RepID=A0A0G2UT42_9CARY|nr:cytochrome P450 76AD1-like protein [Acleisanthes lanceolata]